MKKNKSIATKNNEFMHFIVKKLQNGYILMHNLKCCSFFSDFH